MRPPGPRAQEPGFEVPESIRGVMEHVEGPNGEAWSVEDIDGA